MSIRINDQKRYVVKVDFYVYADNDQEASKVAIDINKSIKKLGDVENQSTILEIGEQPFASFNYRPFDLINEPIDNVFKSKTNRIK